MTFTVWGIPQPKGSTRAFNIPGRRFPVVTSDNPKLKAWEKSVRTMAQQAQSAYGAIVGPVRELPR